MTGPGRRAVLGAAGGVVAGAAAASAGWALSGSPAAPPAPVTSSVIQPDADLMREHGVLKRVLLCYREMITQVQGGHPVAVADLHDCALVIHDFIEGFHEGLEEGYVFPRVRPVSAVLSGTVTTLLVQHARGRVLTQFLLAQGKVTGQAAAAMSAFVRMYEPHEAREDTVIYPALRQIVPPAEFAAMGQHFTDLEHQQFGTDEFTAMVTRMAGIEQRLGIYDLAQFTPETGPFAPPA